MSDRELPSPELLRQLLRYEPETGKLFWLPRTASFFEPGKYNCNRRCAAWNAKYAGKEALAAKHGNGYLSGAVFDQRVFSHRVIWAIQTGNWPVLQIDHIDGNRANNRWNNLRQASRSENMKNVRSHKGSTSKYLGVSWASRDRRWVARIRVNGKYVSLGSHRSEIDAAIAYDKAAAQHHGSFANLNFPNSTIS